MGVNNYIESDDELILKLYLSIIYLGVFNLFLLVYGFFGCDF